MKIELISHASILITCGQTQILTDPWYISQGFNNSWSLLGAKQLTEEELAGIQYIWISHEHPDHFNVPTLRAFPEWFRKQVTILFQTKNSEKLFSAMKNWGFTKFQSIPNHTMMALNTDVQIYCHPTHLGDSCLGVRYHGKSLFNINDAELSEEDCASVLHTFGTVDVITNQFSLAGYLGFANYEELLPKMAEDKLLRLSANHKHLQAKTTIPFASFVYFSTIDNRFMNRFANTPETVVRYMAQQHQQTHFMGLGEVFDLEHPEFTDAGLEYWQQTFRNIGNLEYSTPEVIGLEKLQSVAMEFTEKLYRYYPRPLLWMLRPIQIYIPDLQVLLCYDARKRALSLVESNTTDAHADIIVYSQPLWFSFKFNWGFETLAVSSRVLVKKNYMRFKLIKNLSILLNQEIYLKPKYLMEKEMRSYVTDRLANGLARQILRKSLSNIRLSRS